MRRRIVSVVIGCTRACWVCKKKTHSEIPTVRISTHQHYRVVLLELRRAFFIFKGYYYFFILIPLTPPPPPPPPFFALHASTGGLNNRHTHTNTGHHVHCNVHMERVCCTLVCISFVVCKFVSNKHVTNVDRYVPQCYCHTACLTWLKLHNSKHTDIVSSTLVYISRYTLFLSAYLWTCDLDQLPSHTIL